MFEFLMKNATTELVAPVTGNAIPLEEVKDQVFASKMMGDGLAFQFDGDTIYAPCDGVITMFFKTKHAFGITARNSAEIMIHVGMDTVNLNGEGFTVLKGQGTKIRKGDAILKIDRALMKEKNIDLTTPMIITNGDDVKFTVVGAGKKVTQGKDVVVTF